MNQAPSRLEEVDLYYVMNILIKRKFTVIMIALLFTIGMTIKVSIAPPVYSGNVYLEIGEVVNTYETANNLSSTIIKLDNINNLKEITKVAMASSTTLVNMHITTQNGTDNLLNISMESTDPKEIQSKLFSTVKYILNRHAEKVKIYQSSNSKIRMTKIIGKINVDKEPKDTKKLFISVVAFFGGLVLGIFLVFVQELITSKRLSTQNDDK